MIDRLQKRRAGTGFRILVAALALAGTAGGAPAVQDDASEWPPVFTRLEGSWEGEGTLFGSGAAFTMEWTPVLGGRFFRLRFSNALVGPEGRTPVLEAEAFYRVEEDGGLGGHWFDTRGVIIDLGAAAEGDRLVTDWVLPGVESGRTTYHVVDADTVEVTDEVRTADGWNAFGGATYHRRR